MSRVEYEYFIDFSYPESINPDSDFDKTYIVDDTSYFTIRDNQGSKGCTFTLYTKQSTDDAEAHDPTAYELYAIELERLYKIVKLSITYLTGYIVKGNQSNDQLKNMSDSLPKIQHNFYDRCKRANVNLSRQIGIEEFRISAYIINKLNPERLELLNRMIKSTKSDIDNVKLDVLESYFKGFISRICPYFDWYHIVEVFLNPKLKFFQKTTNNEIPDFIKFGNNRADLKFLRLYAHRFRHSSHHINSIKAAKKLASDPKRAIYLDSPQKARSYYEMNLRIILDQIIRATRIT